MIEVVLTAPDNPAARANGTVRPSDIPITISRTVSPAVKCCSMCGVCGTKTLLTSTHIFLLFYSIAKRSGMSEEECSREDQRTSTNHLDDREQPARAEVAVTDRRDKHQLEGYDDVGRVQCRIDIRYQERQRVQDATKEGHSSRNQAAYHGTPSAGFFF